MTNRSLLLSWTFVFIWLTAVHAMFFTESRENEYPRLGKRLRPFSKSVYRKWSGLQNSRNIYTYDSDNMDFDSTSDVNTDSEFQEKDREDMEEAGSRLTPDGIQKRLSFAKKLQFYLTLDSDRFY